jgi:replicative DNA helicase
MSNAPSDTPVIRTGLTALDAMLGGLKPGITTIASRSSMGKSILVYTILEFASRQGLWNEKPSPAQTLLFSGEASWEVIAHYLLAVKTGVPRRIIERGSGTEEQHAQVSAALADMKANNKIFFLPDIEWDISSIRKAVEEHSLAKTIDFLVLDGPNSSDYRQNPDLMDELEDIAIAHQLPILVTHDLDSLYLDQRFDKRPTLFDLVDTPLISKKSNVILFLYRDVFYNRETDNPKEAEIIVAKNDYGETGTVIVQFLPEISRFEDVDPNVN